MTTVGRTKLRVDDVCQAARTALRIRLHEIFSRSQAHRVAHPRQLVMAVAHELGCASTTKIGHIFGRDHTTVMHAKRRVAEREAASVVYKDNLDQLRLSLLVYRAQIEQAGWNVKETKTKTSEIVDSSAIARPKLPKPVKTARVMVRPRVRDLSAYDPSIAIPSALVAA